MAVTYTLRIVGGPDDRYGLRLGNPIRTLTFDAFTTLGDLLSAIANSLQGDGFDTEVSESNRTVTATSTNGRSIESVSDSIELTSETSEPETNPIGAQFSDLRLTKNGGFGPKSFGYQGDTAEFRYEDKVTAHTYINDTYVSTQTNTTIEFTAARIAGFTDNATTVDLVLVDGNVYEPVEPPEDSFDVRYEATMEYPEPEPEPEPEPVTEDDEKNIVNNNSLSEDDVTNIVNNNSLSEDDVTNIVNNNSLSEDDVINIINNTFNDNADDWWENEVKPELEKINSTLQDILQQHTAIASETKTIASEIETIDTAIQKIRDLADHPNGPGIRTISPYGYLGDAILYQLYVKQGQVLADAELDPAAQEESLNKINEIITELFSNLDPNQGGFE
jgi:hypothetical protein